ncbi:hypothetical protein KC19_10G067200 [Ceratodon purpureus]|uniref:Uncharacterized protein n=1 Tax=Ceratodon purpureus TaxID=3225 RepID=A0A8T0GL40_CERPU|nr:hypothetical protein KC19_10G067200 [Ceratodon purpureus]
MFLVEDVERVERAVCLWAKVWLGSHCNVVEEIPPGCNAGGLLQRRQLGTSLDGDFEFHHPVDLFVGRVD